MSSVRNLIIAALVVTIFGRVNAQPSDGGGSAELDVSASAGVTSKLSPAEMTRQADTLIGEIDAAMTRLTSLQKSARDAKDVIKLNCINDKLLQLKQIYNIAESGRQQLGAAISTNNEQERYHQFTVVTISAEKARVLQGEGDACIGEEMMIGGGSTIDVDSPDIVDDPTRDDPFALTGFELERPTYATPFL